MHLHSHAATWRIQIRSWVDLPQRFRLLPNYFGSCLEFLYICSCLEVKSVACCAAGHVSYDVSVSGAATRSSRQPEPVWRRLPVAKPPMSDALWEATRTEVLGSDVFQRISQSTNYDLYQVYVMHWTSYRPTGRSELGSYTSLARRTSVKKT